MYTKKVKYKNYLGELCFDGHTLFCEEIDAAGTPAIAAMDQLAAAHGSITTDVHMGPKTIPCLFKFVDRYDDDFMQNEIVKIMNPLITGVLTIFTKTGTYDIDCRPSELPSIKRTDVSWIYQFSVDFIADYPCFRQQGIIRRSLAAGSNTINSSSVPDTPIKIYIPDCSAGANIQFENRLGMYRLKMLPFGGAVTVNTENFKAFAYNGNDITNKIDLTSKIEKIKLTYGKNIIVLHELAYAEISYYNLAWGVI